MCGKSLALRMTLSQHISTAVNSYSRRQLDILWDDSLADMRRRFEDVLMITFGGEIGWREYGNTGWRP
jgi:hypothetical protein